MKKFNQLTIIASLGYFADSLGVSMSLVGRLAAELGKMPYLPPFN